MSKHSQSFDKCFCEREFSDFIDEFEKQSAWEFSGETELILLPAVLDKESGVSLDLTRAVVCNLEQMCRDGAISSVRAFFTSVIRFAKASCDRNPTWIYSDSEGFKIGKSALKQTMLSILPEHLRDSYTQAEHFAIRDLT